MLARLSGSAAACEAAKSGSTRTLANSLCAAPRGASACTSDATGPMESLSAASGAYLARKASN